MAASVRARWRYVFVEGHTRSLKVSNALEVVDSVSAGCCCYCDFLHCPLPTHTYIWKCVLVVCVCVA